METVVPDRNVIARFTTIVSPILDVSQGLRSQILNLRQTRDLLLPRLLAGQVDVKPLEAIA